MDQSTTSDKSLHEQGVQGHMDGLLGESLTAANNMKASEKRVLIGECFGSLMKRHQSSDF
jgi:hypothetical protein